MKRPTNPSEDVVAAIGIAILFFVAVVLSMAIVSCSTIKVNASQVDGTISVTSTPNQPVQVSVTTNIKDPDIQNPIVSL